jgi:hypothetical protein
VPLHSQLVKQYQVDNDDLKHFLQSLLASLHFQGYACCKDLLWEPKMFKKKHVDKPQKFAVANSFGIDHFPDTIKFKNKNSEMKIHSIDAEWDL